MNVRTLHVLFLVLFSFTGVAQIPQYSLNRVHEEDGLKTTDVLDISRDDRGFLWLSTPTTVFGFDGKHTLRFTFDEAVYHIHVDSRQRKWVSTRKGLYLLHEPTRQFNQVLFKGEGNNNSAQWYEPVPGEINAILKGKHFVFDENTQSFLPEPLPDVSVRITRFIGTHQQWRFYGNKDTIIRYHPGKAPEVIAFPNLNTALVIGKDEVIVSDNRFHTYKLNFKNHSIRLLSAPALPLFGEKLVCFSNAALSDSVFLFASNKGLFQYQIRSGEISFPELYYQGLPFENQSSVSYFYTDTEGTLYMNSADGIFMLNTASGFIRHIRNYNYKKERLPGNDVRNFTEDKDGHIWIGTTSGIARLNPVTGSIKSFNPLSGQGLIDFPSYRQLLADENLIWIGTSGNGIWFYNMLTGKCERPEFLNDHVISANEFRDAYIWSLVKLRNGKLFAAAASQLYLIDIPSKMVRRIPYTFSPKVSRAALQDAAGRIWHGTTEGLTCFDSTFQPLFHLRDSLPDKRVAAFCEWKPGFMLLGSRGLFVVTMEGNKIKSFAQKKAISAERFIYCMQQDRLGYVWLGTDDGIYRYDPEKEEAQRFDASDGVQTQAFNSDGAFMSSKAVLYMGGRNGFNYFKPENYIERAEVLQPFVLSFTVTIGDSILNRLPGKIPYHGRNIDFVISAPELKRPFQIQYRYRFKTTNDNWTYTGFNNHIRISTLAPGDYQLQVSASYDNKTWFDSQEIISLSVMRPWWQTWWFFGICLLVAVLCGWAWSVLLRRRREANEIKRMMDYFSYSGTADASVDLILWDIARNCISRLGFEDCVIYLLDEKRGMLVQKAAFGAKNPGPFIIANPIEIPIGKGITGHVAQSGNAEMISDTRKDSRYIIDDLPRLSELAVPLLHDGKVIGVIDSENSKRNFFTVHHLQALQTVASLCASKIATTQAMESVRKAEADLQMLNGKMTEARFMNLRLQMNPHFLFNILTTIQYLIISNQVNKATTYLDIFSGFLRALLDHAEENVVTLEEDLRILKLYVELESLCLDETFEWAILVDEEIDMEDVLVPFMLLQPFVENAIQHGLIHRTGVKCFTIRVEEDGDSLRCIVEDNGIGRRAASEISNRSLSRAVHQSKGIGIVEKRLELLQQKTGKAAFLHFEDLMENGVATGTRVTITLPDYKNIDV